MILSKTVFDAIAQRMEEYPKGTPVDSWGYVFGDPDAKLGSIEGAIEAEIQGTGFG